MDGSDWNVRVTARGPVHPLVVLSRVELVVDHHCCVYCHPLKLYGMMGLELGVSEFGSVVVRHWDGNLAFELFVK